MADHESTKVTTSATFVRALVQVRDIFHWDRLMADEHDDDNEQERWDGPESSWLVWYRRRFKDEWLFPPAVTNTTDAREEPSLPVSHRHAAQVYREEFMVWRVTRNRTTDRLFEVGQHLEKTACDADIALILLQPMLPRMSGDTVPISGAIAQMQAAGIEGFLTSDREDRDREVTAVMEEDKDATNHFTGALERIGVISDRREIWTWQHSQTVSQKTPIGLALSAITGGFPSLWSKNVSQGVETHRSRAMALRHKVPLMEREKRYLGHVSQRGEDFFIDV